MLENMVIGDTNRIELEAVLEKIKLCDIDTNTDFWPTESYGLVGHRKNKVSEKRAFRASHKWQRIRKKRLSDFGQMCPVTLESEPLEVHHIDFDVFNSDDLKNLIPLWAPYHRLIHARAEMYPFYESLDRAVFLSVTRAWRQ